MKTPETYRQGDVLLRRVNHKPKPTKSFKKAARDERGRVVLAEGELTGHAHAISEKGASLFEQIRFGETRRLLTLSEDSHLRHEEHETIPLPKGTYEVIQQREYEPDADGEGGWRSVAD